MGLLNMWSNLSYIKQKKAHQRLRCDSVVAFFATTASDEKTYVEIHFIENFEKERKRLQK